MYSIEAGKSLPGIRKALRVVTQGFSKKNISYGEAKPQSINIFLHGCSHRRHRRGYNHHRHRRDGFRVVQLL